MYELIQVSDNCFYIQSPAKIGLVKINDTEVCLIDSGNDKDAGKKVKKILDANGWTLKAIYNTHSNADHIGGNKYLQSQTGCKIYAPGIEADFTNHPILEPSYLYGGCPPKDLRHKFLLAQESNAEYLTKENLPEGWEIIQLPGHFFDMVGFRTPDDVVYLADCLSSKMTLDKYGITVLYDVESYLQTLEMIKNMKAKLFIPAHAEATEEISELAQYNIDKVHEVAEHILEICAGSVLRKTKNDEQGCSAGADCETLNSEQEHSTGMNFEAILQKLFQDYGLVMTFEQYVLVGSTVRSYLAWLKDTGRVNVKFEDNMLLWATV